MKFVFPKMIISEYFFVSNNVVSEGMCNSTSSAQNVGGTNGTRRPRVGVVPPNFFMFIGFFFLFPQDDFSGVFPSISFEMAARMVLVQIFVLVSACYLF